MKGNHLDDLDLGACCACGKTGSDVRNIMMLPRQAPVPGTGWGCFVCGLPPDGAVAALCDTCLEARAAIRYACVGYPKDNERVAVEELTESFAHDPRLHELELEVS